MCFKTLIEIPLKENVEAKVIIWTLESYNYSLDSSVCAGRFGGSSSLLLGAGESLQTMVFSQPVDEEKQKINNSSKSY